MGAKKYLPLTPHEVIRVLKALGFSSKRTRGDHQQWEGHISGKRRVVTVQLIQGEYSILRGNKLDKAKLDFSLRA